MIGTLPLKLTLVPSLLAGITFAGRRWGPGVAGWLSAFPVVSAPILFFITLEQGRPFAAQAAGGTLSGVLAILAFGMAYAWSATRFAWPLCGLLSLTAYGVAVALLDLWAPSLPVTAVAVGVALTLAPRAYPPPGADPPPRAVTRAFGDVWIRMLAGALIVLTVTHFSAALGPRLSGLFAMFPVLGSVLAIFSHREVGAAFTIRLLRGMLLGYYAFAIFCLVLALTLEATGTAPAFGLAMGAATVVQGVSRLFLRRSMAAPVPAPSSSEV